MLLRYSLALTVLEFDFNASAYSQCVQGAFAFNSTPDCAFLGDKASDYVTNLFKGRGLYMGRGAYTGADGEPIHANNLIANAHSVLPTVPHLSGSNDETGAVTISHREYLTDIYAPGSQGAQTSVPFQNTAFALNPGLQSTFPFLSQIAQNYDEYELIQCIFHYRSTTTDIGNSTSGQCGTVIMATNYNPAQPAFTDKQQMMEYAHAHSCKTTESMVHGVECDPSKNSGSAQKFIRSNPVVTDQDLKTYDLGTFQIAIANAPPGYSGLPVGELWVEYKVVLRKPKLFVTRGLETDQDLFVTVQNSASVTGSQPFGNLQFNTTATSTGIIPTGFGLNTLPSYWLQGQQNNIGCSLAVHLSGNPGASYLFITFPASTTGFYEIQVSLCNFGGTTGNSINIYPVTAQGSITEPVSTGNIYPVYDMYAVAGSPQGNWFTQINNSNMSGTYSAFIGHVYVKQSTNGVNNTICLRASATGGIVALQVQAFVKIQQIQSSTLIAASQSIQTQTQPMPTFSGFRRPQFINNANSVTVP